MHHRANLPLDMDLCHLLQAMQLESIEKQVSVLSDRTSRQRFTSHWRKRSTLASNKADDTMTVDLNYLVCLPYLRK